MTQLYIHKGQPLVLRELNQNISYFAPIKYEELKEEPCPVFSTGKMSLSLWRTIASFFRKVHKDEKAEAQVRLFYSDTAQKWKAHAFPQEKGSGMTTKELDKHEDFDKQMQEVLEGGLYFQWGTIHSHCDAGAFQSGTDKHDEEKAPGLHVTMGKIASPKIDLHSRFTLLIPGEIYTDEKGEQAATKAQFMFCPVNLTDFVELPEIYVHETAPSEIKNFAFNYLLTENSEDLVEETLIESWMKNRIEKVVYPLATATNTGGYGSSASHWGGELISTSEPRSSKWQWDTWKNRYKPDKKEKKKKKQKLKLESAVISGEEKEILEPLIDNICQMYGVTKAKLGTLLSTPEHEISFRETFIMSAVHNDILSSFGISKIKFTEILDNWPQPSTENSFNGSMETLHGIGCH